MNFTMVASDYDDTLVPLGELMPARTHAALQQLRHQQVKLAMVSGRSTHGLRVQLRRNQIDFDGLYLIGFNGAQAVQAWDDTVLFEHRLDPEVAVQAARLCTELGAAPMAHRGHQMFTTQPDHFAVVFEAESNDLDVVEVADFAELPFVPVKLLIGGDNEVLVRLRERLLAELGDAAEVFLSAGFLMEFTANGVNKGAALRGLCAALAVPLDEVVVFGDNYNDVPLLQAGGLAVAVANAVPELLAVADRVSGPTSECGVADVLDELFGAEATS